MSLFLRFSIALSVLAVGATARAQPLIEGVDIPNASRELRRILYERHEIRQELEEAKEHVQRLKDEEARLNELVDLRMQLDAIEKRIDDAKDGDDRVAMRKLEGAADRLEARIEHLLEMRDLEEQWREQQAMLHELEELEADEFIDPLEIAHAALGKLRELKAEMLAAMLKGADAELDAMAEQAEGLEDTLGLGEEYLGLLEALREAQEEEEREEVASIREKLDEVAKLLRGEEVPATEDASLDPRHQPILITDAGLERVADMRFSDGVIPLLRQFCFECHGNDSESGELNLERMVHEHPIVIHRDKWINVLEQTKNRVMPPEDGALPNETQRADLVHALHRAIYDFDYSQIKNPGHERARRLTHDEYDNTVRDLFGVDPRPAQKFPTDLTGSSGFDNSANTLFIQPLLMERYLGAAEMVVESALPPEPKTKAHRRARQIILESASEEALMRADRRQDLLKRFLTRAYRRPVTDRELQRAEAQWKAARELEATPLAAMKTVMRTALVSPKFLLKTEHEPDSRGGDYHVNNWELANRLSYFLWASMPDRELFDLARQGTLSEPEVLTREVDRMLDDDRSSTLGSIFAAQWLGSRHLGTRVRMDPIDNPWCTDSLMAAMRDETAMFFHTLVRENQPIPRLIDADFTFLNEELAKHYKIRGVRGESMQRVSLRDHERGGIFGHGSLLAVTSFPYRTSPVVRGKWILADVLGTPPPPPPPNVSELPEEIEENDRLTFRQKLELHRKAPNCYACHSQIDALGFSLEGYDFFGRARRSGRRGGKPDVRGTLPNGTEFEGLSGLKRVVLEQRLEDLCRQVTSKMLSYALGRQLEYYDEPAIRRIVSAVETDGYRFRTLIHEIVSSYPFRYKRGQADE